MYWTKLFFLHSIEADAVIMAIPAGPSLSVNFKPKLSVQKTHALRTTPYSSSTKVILAFETPFWDKDNNNKVGGSTLTDLPVKQIYYEMNRAKGGIFLFIHLNYYLDRCLSIHGNKSGLMMNN